ncbi:MAG: hypothetical protein FWE06_04280 [Oscillospiraceae bacterium]|nr:hypothetical protein [Oscillospiraceae bacterium]
MQKIYTITDRLSRVKPWVWLLLALLVTLFTRLAWVLLTRNIPANDFLRYHELAAHYAEHNIILMRRFTSIFPHTWGYTMVLSWVYNIFGASHATAYGFNIVLCLAIVSLIYDIGAKLFTPWIGGVAALIWALMPGQILFSNFIAAELLHLAIMLAAINLYVRMNRAETLKMRLILACVCGLATAFSAIVRPIGLVLLLAFMLHLVIVHATRTNRFILLINIRRFCRQGLLLCLLIPMTYFGVMAVYEHAYLAPALQRSERLADETRDWRPAMDTPEWQFIIGMLDPPHHLHEEIPNRHPAMNGPGWNLLVGMHAPTNGFLTHHIGDTFFYPVADDHSITAQQAQRIFMRQAARLTGRAIQNGALPQLLREKARHMWGSDDWAVGWAARHDTSGLVSVTSFERPLRFAANAYYRIILTLALAAAALWLLRKKSRKLLSPALPLMIILTGLFFLSLLVETHPRYTFPANTLLILVGASLLTHLIKPPKTTEELSCKKSTPSPTGSPA